MKFYLSVLFLLEIMLFGLNSNKIYAAEWLSGWSYRKAITISRQNISTSNLINFPIFVKIESDSDLSKALINGYDIRFTSNDGTTLLSYERGSWSGGGSSPASANFWVKIPSISYSAQS